MAKGIELKLTEQTYTFVNYQPAGGIKTMGLGLSSGDSQYLEMEWKSSPDQWEEGSGRECNRKSQ